MTNTVYLVRHGATLANLENRFAGRTGEELHEKGVGQIRGVAAKLEPLGISGIYTGPLPRTVQSAEILSQALGVGVEVVPGLTEILIPHWDGLTKDEIRERYGGEYPTWLASPPLFAVPGCETIAAVQRRAVAAVQELAAARKGAALVIVSHLIVLRTLILHYHNRPLDDFREIKINNGDVIPLEIGSPSRADREALA